MVSTTKEGYLWIVDCSITSDVYREEVENPNQRRSTIIIVRKGRIRIGGAIDAPDGEESKLGVAWKTIQTLEIPISRSVVKRRNPCIRYVSNSK